MSRSTPTFRSIVESLTRDALSDMFTMLPGRVVSYNASRQSVDVQPEPKRAYVDEAGERQVENYPVVTEVPVGFPGAGGVRLTWPLAAGDVVMLLFASTSLDRWLSVAGNPDPADERRNSITDAVAIPGLHSFASVPTSAPTDASVWHSNVEIRLGSPDANDPVARKSDLDTVVSKLNSLISKFGAHVHGGVTTGGGFSGTTAPAESIVVAPSCSPDVKVP